MSLAIDQTIEGKKLEESQKIAIQKSGKNICVNAGAGSGKTLTIIGNETGGRKQITITVLKAQNFQNQQGAKRRPIF